MMGFSAVLSRGFLSSYFTEDAEPQRASYWIRVNCLVPKLMHFLGHGATTSREGGRVWSIAWRPWGPGESHCWGERAWEREDSFPKVWRWEKLLGRVKLLQRLGRLAQVGGAVHPGPLLDPHLACSLRFSRGWETSRVGMEELCQ